MCLSVTPDDGSKELWKVVKADPWNFDGWTKLLQYAETNADIGSAETAFDGFLKRFPFCYGYWRKYAELEKRNRRYEKALNVGLPAV